MFADAFQKMELEDRARILDQIQEDLEGTIYDPLETTLLYSDLSFYPGYQILEISNTAQTPNIQRHVVYSPQEWQVIDFTNKTLYDLNDKIGITLDSMNVFDYIRFFFRYVKGRHGHFHIAESVDDIRWKDDPPPQARKAVGSMIAPIALVSMGQKKDDAGTFYCNANMIFKNALFKSDVTISPQGHVKITNEELLIDDMPILDDVLGQ